MVSEVCGGYLRAAIRVKFLVLPQYDLGTWTFGGGSRSRGAGLISRTLLRIEPLRHFAHKPRDSAWGDDF